VAGQYRPAWKNLLIRVLIVVLIIGLLIGIGVVSRRLALRRVQDPNRRQVIGLVHRFVMLFAIAVVVLLAVSLAWIISLTPCLRFPRTKESQMCYLPAPLRRRVCECRGFARWKSYPRPEASMPPREPPGPTGVEHSTDGKRIDAAIANRDHLPYSLVSTGHQIK